MGWGGCQGEGLGESFNVFPLGGSFALIAFLNKSLTERQEYIQSSLLVFNLALLGYRFEDNAFLIQPFTLLRVKKARRHLPDLKVRVISSRVKDVISEGNRASQVFAHCWWEVGSLLIAGRGRGCQGWGEGG